MVPPCLKLLSLFQITLIITKNKGLTKMFYSLILQNVWYALLTSYHITLFLFLFSRLAHRFLSLAKTFPKFTVVIITAYNTLPPGISWFPLIIWNKKKVKQSLPSNYPNNLFYNCSMAIDNFLHSHYLFFSHH